VELHTFAGHPYLWNDLPDTATAGAIPGGTPMRGIVEIATQSDIQMISAELQSGNAVQFTYETTGNPPGPFEVGLYRSADGVSYDVNSPLDIQTVTPTAPNATGSGTLALQDPLPYDADKPLLVVVADPRGLVSESDDPINANNKVKITTHALAWGRAVSNEFNQKVVTIAGRLGTNPNWLMAAMAFETNGTFRPSFRDGSGVGLLQFQPQTAKLLGTTIDQLAAMTVMQQLDYVELYLQPYAGRMNTVGDMYMAILYPIAIGQLDSYVLFNADSSDPHNRKEYRLNKYLDVNGDGKVTKAEVTVRFLDTLNKGLGSNYLGCYFDP
jgi:hypothetical protein